MEYLNNFFESFASIAWGQPTQLLLLGAGLYFAITAKFHPYRYITYAFDILRGKHPSTGEGEVRMGKTVENGCPTWTRTRNQVINSHLLYH